MKYGRRSRTRFYSVFSKTASSIALVIFLCAPQISEAGVVITEFLYDAEGTDTDKEYVEIYNNGSVAVDLTKWKINDGSNHTLNVPPKNGGSGSITLAPGAYALLVNDATGFIPLHPGISISIIDTVLSLSNTGTTILLLDENGATADSVVYTKDQGANGDGNSLQKNAAGQWIVAVSTPGSANSETAASPPEEEEETQTETQTNTETETQTQTSSQSTPAVSSYVPPPVPTLFADAGLDRIVIVGADAIFTGRAYDRGKNTPDLVRYAWNFGDGSTAEGITVMHRFEYPGKYAVVLNVAHDKNSASDRLVVTAEPAKLAFQVLPDGSVSIQNNAGRDLDLSHWIVAQSFQTFMLPSESVILAGQTLRIPQKTLRFFPGTNTELQYPNGTLALRAGESAGTQPASVQTVMSEPEPEIFEEEDIVASEEDIVVTKEEIEEMQASSSEQVASAASAGTFVSPWFLGAIGLAFAGAGAGWYAKKAGKKEWDIEEMS